MSLTALHDGFMQQQDLIGKTLRGYSSKGALLLRLGGSPPPYSFVHYKVPDRNVRTSTITVKTYGNGAVEKTGDLQKLKFFRGSR